MPVTTRFYGGSSIGGGRIIQDFCICDVKNNFIYTAKIRPKGMLIVSFIDIAKPASAEALAAVQAWAGEIGQEKWTALALAEGDREALIAYGEQNGLDKITLAPDYDRYRLGTWGVSQLPTTFLIDGKTGRAVRKLIGADPDELSAMRSELAAAIDKIVAAEKAAAEKAAAEKAAAEAAAKK